MDVLDAEFVAGATALGQLPAPTFAEVAFAGRSNVGKSSLINNLVRRKKLVRTSSAPGCSRAINIFRVRIRTNDDEAHLDLVDLPGYGYAQRSKAERRSWGPLIEGFLRERPGLRGAVVIIDVRRGAQDDDVQLLSEVEKDYILAVLDLTDGNQTRTAQQLGLGAATLYRKLKKYGLLGKSQNGQHKMTTGPQP